MTRGFRVERHGACTRGWRPVAELGVQQAIPVPTAAEGRTGKVRATPDATVTEWKTGRPAGKEPGNP